ncbi:MAG: phosphonate metabolism transcriptional regulator PhnF [Cyanobacteria bacterium SBLK]|nr:phosphonate metabolism transcriptional regulator PhnF [Cyanobacteria bacterium SBLK]
MSSPVYTKIADELRKNIQDRVYSIGERLPPEIQLSERFGVNRHTLRRAISLLRNEGLVRVDRGRGTFVASIPIRYPIGKRVRYNKALKAQGQIPSTKTIRCLEIPANETIAEELQLNFGDGVALIERLGLADKQPISICTSYFPLQRFPDILQQMEGRKSISKLLREVYNCDHLRKSTRVSARPIKPDDARLLQVPLNQPILLVESMNVDREGKAIEYGVTRFRGDRMELVVENDLSE